MDYLTKLAALIKKRNAVEKEMARIIGRPALIGHVGEFIASRIFSISLEEYASRKAVDGHFIDGPLAGRSVNIKWYARHEGLLDITPDALPEYYLVLTGPMEPAVSSRGSIRPWLVRSAFLFDAKVLVDKLNQRGVKIDVATSVAREFWEEAEVYPPQRNRQPPNTLDMLRPHDI